MLRILTLLKMVKDKYKYALNASRKEVQRDRVSVMQPNMVRSVKELMERHLRGEFVMGADPSRLTFPDENVKFDDLDLEKLGQMDLFDAAEVVKEQTAKWAAATKALNELRKKELKDKLDQERRAASRELDEEEEEAKPRTTKRKVKKRPPSDSGPASEAR